MCGADTRADGRDIVSFVMKEDKRSIAVVLLRFVLFLTMKVKFHNVALFLVLQSYSSESVRQVNSFDWGRF